MPGQKFNFNINYMYISKYYKSTLKVCPLGKSLILCKFLKPICLVIIYNTLSVSFLSKETHSNRNSGYCSSVTLGTILAVKLVVRHKLEHLVSGGALNLPCGDQHLH